VPIDKLSANAFATGAVANSLGFTPANKAGDTFTGTVTANTLVVSTNTATIGTALYVVANGSIGIGTDSPGAGIKLDVQGGEIRAGRVDSSSEGGQISLARSSDNASAWYLDVYGNTSTPSLRVVDVSAGAVSLAINSSGAVALRGAVSASGVGITFPATQNASSDANTLDDYEEGTWTPTFGATGLTYTQGATVAKYVKVGRLVTFTASMQWSGKSGGTGNLSVSLPFAASGDSGAWQGHFVIGYSSGINVLTKTGYNDPGSTAFLLTRADSSTSLIQAGDLAAGGHFIFGGTYQT
jgi:hypothetical protein